MALRASRHAVAHRVALAAGRRWRHFTKTVTRARTSRCRRGKSRRHREEQRCIIASLSCQHHDSGSGRVVYRCISSILHASAGSDQAPSTVGIVARTGIVETTADRLAVARRRSDRCLRSRAGRGSWLCACGPDVAHRWRRPGCRLLRRRHADAQIRRCHHCCVSPDRHIRRDLRHPIARARSRCDLACPCVARGQSRTAAAQLVAARMGLNCLGYCGHCVIDQPIDRTTPRRLLGYIVFASRNVDDVAHARTAFFRACAGREIRGASTGNRTFAQRLRPRRHERGGFVCQL